jgi:hypothetical protein
LSGPQFPAFPLQHSGEHCSAELLDTVSPLLKAKILPAVIAKADAAMMMFFLIDYFLVIYKDGIVEI